MHLISVREGTTFAVWTAKRVGALVLRGKLQIDNATDSRSHNMSKGGIIGGTQWSGDTNEAAGLKVRV